MASWRRAPSRFLAAAVGAGLILAACGVGGAPAQNPGAATDAPEVPTGESVTLSVITGFAEGSVFNGPLEILIPELEERSGGRIEVDVSGPEVVPFTEQVDAVGNGVYDIQYTVPLFNAGQVPEGELIYFITGDSSCAEYRDADALDLYDEVHRDKAGVMFLGCGGGGAHGATFLTKQPYDSLEDFRGKVFRGFGLYTRVLDTLGASSVAMPPPDIYGAVERGVVDGAAFPNLGIHEQALYEVVPYILMPPYLPFRYAFYMNPDAYEEMPEDLRQLLYDTVWDLEDEFNAYWVEQREAERELLLEAGMEEVTLSEEDSARLQETVFSEFWAFLEETNPRHAAALREDFESVENR